MRKKRKNTHIRKLKNKKGNKEGEFVYKPFEEVFKDKGKLSAEERHFESKKTDDVHGDHGDEYFYKQAMKGVIPLKYRKRVINAETNKIITKNLSIDSEKQAREYLLSLVNEPSAWDVSFSDEYMEGSVTGISTKTMKRLRRGDFSVQDYIDLHGLTKKDAEDAVNEFIINCYNKGLRCVLIVHGRGLGSVDNQPAIKKELPVWFRRGLLKRIVLAFATARPYDGGTGASYVLLKTR